jgi:hypothetical protein
LKRIEWRMRVHYLDSCNCNWGCPCQFNAPPTNGNCEGIAGIHIIQGSYGNLRLDDLNMLWAASYPGAVHEGHGKASFYIDDRTTEEQFVALSRIMTGEAGGGPFEVYASTLESYQGPRRARIVFQARGIRSLVRADGIAEAVLEPIRNPVTGKIHRAAIELPTGFEARRMEQASLKRGSIDDRYLKFDQSETYGSISEACWKGP